MTIIKVFTIVDLTPLPRGSVCVADREGGANIYILENQGGLGEEPMLAQILGRPKLKAQLVDQGT